MTQQSVSERNATLEKAWGNLVFDHWGQMEWFVKLANTDMAALTPGDIQNLQDQCEAIRMRQISLYPIPSDRKRYPFHGGWGASASPTLQDLESIHAAIAPRLNNLADGAEVSFGPVHVTHTIRFLKSNAAQQEAGYPPHLIFPYAILRSGRQSWPDEFLLRVARLLEEFVDGIRRCPHCKKVFLQLRRNSTYCGRACHSVAGMRKRREADRTQKEVTLQRKKSLKNIQKGRSSNGKKGR